MNQLKKDRAEEVFEDFKQPYDKNQAIAEANRCLYCFDAPCIKVCPTSIDIPKFIQRIAEDNVQGSARAIFDSNILGMSCARVCPVEVLCVGDCVYNNMDQPPIQIGKLQRYATDMAYEQKWSFYEAGEDTGKSVALIGGGPASLACAHMLRRLGHAVTIFEKNNVLGGLNTTGIAPYKMKADASVEEAHWILQIGGIDIQSNVTIPQDIAWSELETKFDAIFIGFGLGPDRYLDLDHADAEGIIGAVDFIEQMKLGQVDLGHVKRAIVVGGGNTALDAVRELKGLDVPQVTMVYRGSEPGMSGYAHEWKAAKTEGVHGAWFQQPLAFEADNGHVTGLVCQDLDANKKPIDGQTTTHPADLILLAIGQGKLGDLVGELGDLEVEWGKIVVDEHGQTTRQGYWAGGDCANGGKEVVNAAAEGKAAALSIDAFLKEAANA